MKTGSESVGKGGYIWNVVIFAQLWFLFDTFFKVTFVIEQPVECGFLNFLIVFFLKEFVAEKLH